MRLDFFCHTESQEKRHLLYYPLQSIRRFKGNVEMSTVVESRGFGRRLKIYKEESSVWHFKQLVACTELYQHTVLRVNFHNGWNDVVVPRFEINPEVVFVVTTVYTWFTGTSFSPLKCCLRLKGVAVFPGGIDFKGYSQKLNRAPKAAITLLYINTM